MNNTNISKYQAYPPMKKPNRLWTDKTITQAPIWCSVDLRDGNQSLEIPMTLQQKLDFFSHLVKIGFKEIEVGFPAASDTEYNFLRRLIEDDMIPDDVTVQVLTQSRTHIIEKTFEALAGIKRAIVHLYNSTSTLQRKVVFNMEMDEIKEIAVSGARQLVLLAEKYGRERFMFEYSPESFTGTEMDYAIQVCNAVIEVIKPTADKKLIINLPSTVEMTTPNVYADQIEYVCENLMNRENVIVSLHAHNDRGTAVAATELALMAGAERVEGTLFGNGERTGNADLVNLALNLYTQGINPGLDFSAIDESIKMYEETTDILIHPRHPYAGSLVFTAFSGSHQDAINKGFAYMKKTQNELWSVPYLPIDPLDIGRNYDPVIRINSQSGKGGVAFILEKSFGLQIPKNMHPIIGGHITKICDLRSKDLTPDEIFALFNEEFVNLETPVKLLNYSEDTNGSSYIVSNIEYNGKPAVIKGKGGGLIDAYKKALSDYLQVTFDIDNYYEHSLDYGSGSRAITYIKITSGDKSYLGAGISRNISKSSIKALVSAVNKLYN